MAIAYFSFNGLRASTLNFTSFSQITFAFTVTPQLAVQALVYALILGLFGGLLPSIRAARQPILPVGSVRGVHPVLPPGAEEQADEPVMKDVVEVAEARALFLVAEHVFRHRGGQRRVRSKESEERRGHLGEHEPMPRDTRANVRDVARRERQARIVPETDWLLVRGTGLSDRSAFEHPLEQADGLEEVEPRPVAIHERPELVFGRRVVRVVAAHHTNVLLPLRAGHENRVFDVTALSVVREGGRTIVRIASDDNFMGAQRTLLLEFAWPAA
jgi:hypothetical protein